MKKSSAVVIRAILAILFVTSTAGLAQSQPDNTSVSKPGSDTQLTQTEVISDAPPFETLGTGPARPVESSGMQSPSTGPVINEPPPETFTPAAPSQVRPRQPYQFPQQDIRSFELPPPRDESRWQQGELESSPFDFAPQSRLDSGSHDRCGHTHGNVLSEGSEIVPFRRSFSSPAGGRYSRDSLSERECGFSQRCGARTTCPFANDAQSSPFSFTSRGTEFIDRPHSQELESVRREVARLIEAVESEFGGLPNYELARSTNRLNAITLRLEWLEADRASSTELLAEVRRVVTPLRNIKSSLGSNPDATRAVLATRDVGTTLLSYVRKLNETMDSRVPTGYPRARWGD